MGEDEACLGDASVSRQERPQARTAAGAGRQAGACVRTPRLSLMEILVTSLPVPQVVGMMTSSHCALRYSAYNRKYY